MKKRKPFYFIAGVFLLVPVLIFLSIPVEERLKAPVAFPLATLAVMGAFLFLLVIYYATGEPTE